MLKNRSIIFKFFKRRFSSQIDAKPVSICIVGSGPAGFYCCQSLLKNLPLSKIDIYEKLPVPFGLVRYGVAPDHPEVKNVINSFSKTASDPRIKFIGNVSLGEDIYLKDLQKAYNIVVLAYGADQDVKLGIPGENLSNVISARRFVGWYNGLPSDKDLPIDLNAETVSIFGQGNVAIDVARILLKSVDDLKKTDITDHSLSKLAESKIKRVLLIGRRGPLQVAFSIKELREVLKLPDVEVKIDDSLFEEVKEALPNLPRPKKRLTELMLKASSEFKKDEYKKSFHVLFLRSPLKIHGSANSVEEVTLGINSLEKAQDIEIHNQKARLTDGKEILSTELVFRSIGYKSSIVDNDIPFRSAHCIGSTTVLPGVYSTGWISTGPTGVILSTMTNAFDTANTILNDLRSEKLKVENKHGFNLIEEILKTKGITTIDWNGWTKIDHEEIQRGKERNKPREKIVNIDEMLEIGRKSN